MYTKIKNTLSSKNIDSSNTDKIEFLQQELEKVKQESKSKSAFIANLSHEVRNPLSAIIGVSELLTKEDLNEQQSEYVNQILKTTLQLEVLVTNILDYSKIDAQQIQVDNVSTNIRDIIKDVVDLFAPQANKKGVELGYRCSADVPEEVSTDPIKLKQIVTNLVSNAVKFTDQGHIFIDADNISNDPFEAVIVFSISDTGIGINPEMVENIFNSYSQESPDISSQYGGTGLGLSICKELVKLMGGEISVESSKGLGSKFTFKLKFSYPEDEQINENNEIFDVDFVIADSVDIRQKFINDYLTRIQIKAKIASNYIELKENVLNKISPASIVLLDDKLEGLNRRTMKRIFDISNQNNFNIIIMASVGSIVKNLNQYKNVYVVKKPVSSQELYAKLDEIKNKILDTNT